MLLPEPPKRRPPDPAEIADIYVDESSQTKNRYLVLGGLAIERLAVPVFEAAFDQLRRPELPEHELKWGRVSKAKFGPYLRIAHAFWSRPEFLCAHFHALVVDTHRLDHEKFNQGSSEVGFNKEIYQLAMKFRREYTNLFHLYLDYRDTNQKPEDLRLILNRGAARKNDKRDWPFRRCHFRNSKDCTPLQLVDIFIGAIAYQLNGHASNPAASPARRGLSRRILASAHIKNPFVDTKRSGRFTIWHRQLKPSPRTSVSQP